MKLRKYLNSLFTAVTLISAPAAIYALSAEAFNHTPYPLYVYNNGVLPKSGFIPSGQSAPVGTYYKNSGSDPTIGDGGTNTWHWYLQANKNSSSRIAMVEYKYNTESGEGTLTTSLETNIPYKVFTDLDHDGANLDITVNPYPIMFNINVESETGYKLQVISGNYQTTVQGDNTYNGITYDLNSINDFSYEVTVQIYTNNLGNPGNKISKMKYQINYIGFTSKGIDGGDVSLPENWEIERIQKVDSNNNYIITAEQGSGLNLDITVAQKQTHK